MLPNTKLQMLLVLIAGAAVGYGAASGKFNPLSRSLASTPGASTGKAGCCPQRDSTGSRVRPKSNGPPVMVAYPITGWIMSCYRLSRTPCLLCSSAYLDL